MGTRSCTALTQRQGDTGEASDKEKEREKKNDTDKDEDEEKKRKTMWSKRRQRKNMPETNVDVCRDR